MVSKKENNDFNAPGLVTLSKHGEDIAAIKRRVDNIEEKFGNHEKIANTLCETAATAVKMKEMFTKNFLLLLQSDIGIKNAVTDLVNESDRNYVKSKLKQFGSAIGYAIFFILGALATAIIQKYIK